MREQRKTSQQGSSHQSKTQEHTPPSSSLGLSVWDDMCLGGNYGVRTLDYFSCVFLTTGPAVGIKRFLLRCFLFYFGYQLQFSTTAISWKWICCHHVIVKSTFVRIVSFFPPIFLQISSDAIF